MSAAMTIRLSLSRHIVTTLKKKNALVQGREGAGGPGVGMRVGVGTLSSRVVWFQTASSIEACSGGEGEIYH